MRLSWKIISSASFILTFFDLSIVPYTEMSIYKLLLEDFQAIQIGSKLNSFLCLTWVVLYIILQIIIERDENEYQEEYQNDRWSCILAVSFFCICWVAIFGFQPTVGFLHWRLWAQIAWMSIFLARLMLQNPSLLNHVRVKWRSNPIYEVNV